MIDYVESVLVDLVVSRWPPGQRFCHMGVIFIAAASPRQGALLDDVGRALGRRDLARILTVDARTIERYLTRALEAGRLDTWDGVIVVPEITSLLNAAVDEAVDGVAGARAGPDLVQPGGRPGGATAGGLRARARGMPALPLEQALVVQEPRELWKLPGDLLHQQAAAAGEERVSLGELEHLVAEVRVDDTKERRRLTGAVLGLRAQGLPYAAFARALEQLKTRRRRGALRNEAGYFVRTLRGIYEEDYAR